MRCVSIDRMADSKAPTEETYGTLIASAMKSSCSCLITEKAFESCKHERSIEIQKNRVNLMSSFVPLEVYEYVCAYIRIHPNLCDILALVSDANLPAVMTGWYRGMR